MHEIKIRIYYEDTDAGGVVYYANYLKFAERARTEFLRNLGFNQTELFDKYQIYFVVRKAQISLAKPAKLDDIIIIKTSIAQIKAASMEFIQDFYLDQKLISQVTCLIACVNNNFQPVKLPDIIKQTIS